MKLSARAEAMLAGELGPARRWAVEHQLQVGRMFDAADMLIVDPGRGEVTVTNR